MNKKPPKAGVEVKLADLHPTHQDWSAVAKMIDERPTSPRVRAEQMTKLNDFYHLYFNAAMEREVMDRWYQQQTARTQSELIYWRRLDLLYSWLQMRQQRSVYTELGGRVLLFRRAGEKIWMQSTAFDKVKTHDWGHEAVQTQISHEKQVPGLSTEHEQILTGQVAIKHKKWVADQAYGGQIIHSQRTFANPVDEKPEAPRMPQMKGLRSS